MKQQVPSMYALCSSKHQIKFIYIYGTKLYQLIVAVLTCSSCQAVVEVILLWPVVCCTIYVVEL